MIVRKNIVFAAFVLVVLVIAWTSKPDPEIRICFAGDVMLGRTVDATLQTIADKQLRYNYPWGNVRELMHKTDLMIVNLETTLTHEMQPVPKVFNFKANPDLVHALIAGGIDIVNLANNHILDFGVQGLLETVAVLDQADIAHVGAGANIDDARKPVIVQLRGITVGIIGITDNEPTWRATSQEPGTHYIQVGDIKSILPDITKLRSQVDIVIVTMHWGPNMRERPTQEFRDFAHMLIDHGVDIVHGHSAHIFQGVELYRNKLILYDTGDLVDDYMVDPHLRNDLAALFCINVSKAGPRKLVIIPTIINNMQVNQATGDERDWVLDRIAQLSQELGTKLTHGILEI